jgi:hypothetical protein
VAEIEERAARLIGLPAFQQIPHQRVTLALLNRSFSV